jgi:hypothetical protein
MMLLGFAGIGFKAIACSRKVRCRPVNGFWPDAGGHTSWREKLAVQENAAGKTRYSQDVG